MGRVRAGRGRTPLAVGESRPGLAGHPAAVGQRVRLRRRWGRRRLLAAHTAAEVDPSDLTAVLAGLAGYYVDVARQPAPAGLPTVCAFQQEHARAVLAWVRRRLTAR
jgi:hypothetical protein